MVRQAIAADHNDRAARPRDGLQIVHAHRHLHIESVPRDVDTAGVFAGGQAIEVDDRPLPSAHQFLEWAAAGISISRARFAADHIRAVHLLHTARFNVCYTGVSIAPRR